VWLLSLSVEQDSAPAAMDQVVDATTAPGVEVTSTEANEPERDGTGKEVMENRGKEDLDDDPEISFKKQAEGTEKTNVVSTDINRNSCQDDKTTACSAWRFQHYNDHWSREMLAPRITVAKTRTVNDIL